MTAHIELQPTRTVRPISMDQLFSLQGIPPRCDLRPNSPPLPHDTQQATLRFFHLHYADGLDTFFETDWYSSRGQAHLQSDLTLFDFVAQCAEQFGAPRNSSGGDGAGGGAGGSGTDDWTRQMQSLEARLVWLLATMARGAAAAAAAADASVPAMLDNSPPPDLLLRLHTVEHLLTGQFLPFSRMPAKRAASPSYHQQQHQHQQHQHQQQQRYDATSSQLFWHALGRFTATHDDKIPDPSSSNPALLPVTDALADMRKVLLQYEARDSLYSFAVVRHFGGRVRDFDRVRYSLPRPNQPAGEAGPGGPGGAGNSGGSVSPKTSTQTNPELTDLAVATDFVVAEQNRGMTQVVQTFCRMAMRSWGFMQ